VNAGRPDVVHCEQAAFDAAAGDRREDARFRPMNSQAGAADLPTPVGHHTRAPSAITATRRARPQKRPADDRRGCGGRFEHFVRAAFCPLGKDRDEIPSAMSRTRSTTSAAD